jgi:hypothetical protein
VYTHRPYGPSRSAARTPASLRSSAITLTGQPVWPARIIPRYNRGAEYGQSGSTAHDRHRSAAPAGCSERRKCLSEPKLDTRSMGRPTMWRSQSMSCPDLASSMNDAWSLRRQLPRT